MPLYGFGTWQSPDSEPVKIALQSGYKLIDTAQVYVNHEGSDLSNRA